MRRTSRFFSRKTNRIIPLLLLGLYILSWGAGFFAPYRFDREDRAQSYHPPQQIHLFHNGSFIGPFVYKTESKEPVKIKLFCKSSDNRIHLFCFSDDKMQYLLGADYKGRDILSRILYAGQISLTLGLAGGLIAFFFGSLIGAFSGYIGGTTDNIIMRICELIMMIPGFYLMLAIRGVFPLKADSRQVLFMVVIIMSLIGWAGLARVIRGQVLSIKSRAFVLSSRAIGLPTTKILLKHIIPHTFSYSIVALAISIPSYILGESALSLIGLGIQEPYASWGNMLSEAMNITNIAQHPWLLTPGIMIFITVLLYNLLGEGLKYALDIQENL